MRERGERPNHGPLTILEDFELSIMMASLSLLRQQAISYGVASLPPHMQERAMLDWCRRWEQV